MRRHLPLTGIVLLAAFLRLPTLGSRSLWLDEGAEYAAVRGSLGEMLRRVVDHESTPPLSYAYEWLATKVTGTGEFGLRLPFALVGIAVVPVVYVAARDLAGRRAGLIAAALAATNPLLVWHAQDARSYSLLVLFLTGTIIALGRGRLWWWSWLAVAALATHHFAIFIVAPEAAWLLRERGRAVWPQVAVCAAALVPLAVLAAAQAGARSSWIAGLSLLTRVVQIPAGFIVGYQVGVVAGALTGAALVAALAPALLAALRRPGGRAMLALGTVGIALPLAAVAVGEDFLIQRNVIGSLVAFTIAAAIGFDRLRWGLPVAVGVCAVWIAISVATAGDPKFRREDWRGAVRATHGMEAVLLVPGLGSSVTGYYRHGLLRVDSARVRSLAVLRMGRSAGTGCRIPDAPPRPPALAASVRGRCWRVDRLTFARPRLVQPGDDTLLR